MKNSFKKQLCIDMLRQGYHKSFRELDSILKFQIEDRYRLGSEHPVWDRPLLDQEHVKLEYLGKKLKSAEASESNGIYIHSSFYCFQFKIVQSNKNLDNKTKQN